VLSCEDCGKTSTDVHHSSYFGVNLCDNCEQAAYQADYDSEESLRQAERGITDGGWFHDSGVEPQLWGSIWDPGAYQSGRYRDPSA